jgi:hypothetical protein
MLSAKELMMDEQARSLDKTAIACGLLAAIMGLLFILMALGIIAPGGKSATDSRWIGLIVGLTFLLGGIAVVIQTFARATPDGDLPPGTPMWIRGILFFLALAIVASLAAIGTWVAFGPGEREFNGSIPFLPTWLNEPLGRTVFGTGAILTWIILIVMAVTGMRRLRAYKE